MRLCLLALVFVATQTPALPELPSVDLSGVPTSTRQAIEQALAEVRTDPSNPELNGRLGKLAHAYELYELASVAYGRSLARQPDSFEWLYLSGVVEDLRGNSDAALGFLEKALGRNGGYLPASARLSETFFKLGRLEECRRVARAMLGTAPDYPVGHYWLGRGLLASQQTDTAIRHLRRAVELFPDFGSAHYALALAYRDRGEPETARQAMERYRRNPNRWPASGDRLLQSIQGLRSGAREHLAKGIELADANQIEAAIREHEEALKLQPDLVQGHINLIRLYAQAGDSDKAEEHYRRAVELSPGLTDSHYNYGVLLMGLDRREEALKAFRKVLEVNPDTSAAHNNIGFLFERQGNLEKASSHYRSAIESDPSYRLARFNLGRVLVALKQYEQAVEQFTLILAPEDQATPRYTYALASTFVRMGRRKEGFELAQRAAEMARRMGQSDLAAAIENDLRQLQPGQPR